MEGRGHDRHLQRIIDQAGDSGGFYNHYQRTSSISFPSAEPHNTEWSFGPGPRHTPQEPSTFADPAQPYFDTPRPPLPASNTSHSRLSFPPRGLYNQPSREPRTITNADNHFRFAQNLHQNVPISQQPPPRPAIAQQTDTISQIANAMLHGKQISQPRTGPEPIDYRQPPQPRQPNPLQPQMQQITPPFNLNGLIHTPDNISRASSSPFGQPSSPTARVSLRRATNREAPVVAQDAFVEYTDEPRTLLNQIVPHINRYQRSSTPSQHTTYSHQNVSREDPQSRTLALDHAPPIAHGIQLVSTYELPDRTRQVFPFQLFNAVQSKSFTPIYKTNDNVVISSPTGSGKTALLELAICRAIEGHGSGQFKIVYQAPTKSLCSERMRDWTKKFSHLNLSCAELTGDTSQAEMARVRAASIIITTPEKWDSITRKWTDHHKLVQMVKLFLIDEVHILKDPRGATLETVVSRMKSIGADVRFVALSATVPNSHDIAVWLGRDPTNHQFPAHREIFGEEFRPVKLQKHVYGFEGGYNDYAFEKILDGKLPNLIKKHTHKKPMMVFCFTRKSCEATATLLADWWTRSKVVDRAWPAPSGRTVVGNKEVQDLITSGVAFHHAGLEQDDRHTIENAFLKGDISVICCTSTLAVGVNLPCHLVVLKGTVCFQNDGLAEYSDLEVMQMLGRAGRPQFDDSAVAIIMTKNDKQGRYEKMISGRDILESTLHLNLIEHLNSEIGLGTVNSLYKAKTWLSGTFLAVRMRQNPNYYNIDGILPGGDTDKRLEQVCERDIKLLQDNELITSGDRIRCTEYGEAMSRYMVQFETMKLLLRIPKHAKTEEILHILCQATEFEDMRIKPKERACLREYNKSPFTKFPIKGTINTAAHKVSLLIQAQLGGIEHPGEKDFPVLRRQFSTEKAVIFERIQRLIRCVIDCKAFDCDAIATRHALDLARSLSAGYWETSNLQLRQIPQFGPVAVRKLVSNNINSIEKLASLDTASIERYVSKNPPFGRKTQELLASFPRLTVASQIIGRAIIKPGQKPKVNVKAIIGFANAKVPVWAGRRPSLTFMAETSDGALVHFWRGNVLKLEKGYELMFMVELSDSAEIIKCWIACDDIVGTLRSSVLTHNISVSEFPAVPKETRLQKGPSTRRDSFSDNEFWDDDIRDEDLLAANIVIKKPENHRDSDNFPDVDDYDHTPAGSVAKFAKSAPVLEPFQMANGKWSCNHSCRDGNLLKSGQPCKHKCCHEGLDKPKILRKSSIGTSQQSLSSKEASIKGGEGQAQKQFMENSQAKRLNSKATASNQSKTMANGKAANKSKLSNPKLKEMKPWDDNSDDLEILDMAQDLAPVSYADFAPHDFRKLNTLHNSVQKNQPKFTSLPKQKPQFDYGSGKEARLPFHPNSENDDDVFGSDDEVDLPSPSILLGGQRKSSSPLKTGPVHLTYQEESDISSFQDESLASLEAGMIGLSDSMVLRESTPRIDSSFANKVFDFDAYQNDGQVQAEETDTTENALLLEAPADLSVAKRHLKRELSSSPDELEVKHRRISNSQLVQAPPQIPSVPAWVDEFDSELIEGLKGIVDFID
ncbi:ATP-dependent DNA helicase [Lachnellula hyalina]|uniref:DNA 3'-5' helicase n=1 Tax=Lachnellula hyalina TaxID=1316788 RepID=A0A8H8QU96_9HELO|nr:ATP-dependent DNA helicase [Lachnellula hyalina]TVY22859.1 ATP-dependent DNA helicase [Lachnellula hyalina]